MICYLLEFLNDHLQFFSHPGVAEFITYFSFFFDRPCGFRYVLGHSIGLSEPPQCSSHVHAHKFKSCHDALPTSDLCGRTCDSSIAVPIGGNVRRVDIKVSHVCKKEFAKLAICSSSEKGTIN